MLLEKLHATLRLASGVRILLRHKPDSTYTVADRIEERAAAHGERPFVLFGDRRISYAELNAGANRAAHWAAGQGIARGDVVALLMENRPEFLTTWMGLAKLGAVAALVNTHLAGRALDHALRTAGARILVAGSECLAALETVSSEVMQGLEIWVDTDTEAAETRLPAGSKDFAEALAGQSAANPSASAREGLVAGDLLFYIYTSGTTGNPKAARFSHHRFLGTSDAFAWAAGSTPDDVEYATLPLYHTAGGVVAVGRALSAGCTLALRRRFSASAFVDDARHYRATSFQYIGELCRYLLAQPPSPKDREHSLRVAVGNGLRPDIWKAFQERFGIARIVEFYGATEGNTALVNLDGKVGAVGRYPFKALSNARIVRYDVEADAHPRDTRGFCIECGEDEPGELLGRIPKNRRAPGGHFEGYTSQEESERKILRDVFKPGDAWFRTGDLLQRDADGYYYFVDRIGDTFRWKGENVSTQEVAEIVAGFPGLDMINVYGVEIPGREGRAGMLACVPRSGFDGAAFFRFVEGALPAYAVPLFVRLLPEAEVTVTFKLRKVELQREGFDPERIGDPLWLRDEGAKAYVPLTPALVGEIRDGRRRL